MEKFVFTESCEDALECNAKFKFVDAENSSSLLLLEDDISDSILNNMTSLGTLVFLERSLRHNDEDDSDQKNFNDSHRLTLAYEHLKTIPWPLVERFSRTVRILDISHNEFNNLDFLSEFKSLTSLVADHNDIKSNIQLPYMPKLELLWLNHCKIDELYPWAINLQKSCPNLRHLSLMGNTAAPSYLNGGTFYEYLEYRGFMISLFPFLVHLDDRPVTPEQHNEANNLHAQSFLARFGPMAVQILPPYLQRRLSNIFQRDPGPFQPGILKNCII